MFQNPVQELNCALLLEKLPDKWFWFWAMMSNSNKQTPPAEKLQSNKFNHTTAFRRVRSRSKQLFRFSVNTAALFVFGIQKPAGTFTMNWRRDLVFQSKRVDD